MSAGFQVGLLSYEEDVVGRLSQEVILLPSICGVAIPLTLECNYQQTSHGT